MIARYAVDYFDLESYVKKYGAKSSKKPGEWMMVCPLCGRMKLAVNVVKKNWHCWVCQAYKTNMYGKQYPVYGAGGVIKLIQLLDNCLEDQAKAILLRNSPRLGIEKIGPLNFDRLDDYVEKEMKPPVPIQPPDFCRPITEHDYGRLTYLWQRGITLSDVRVFGLAYCTAGRYANRLVYPVWENGQLVYFQARAMWEGDKRRGFRKCLNPMLRPGMAGASEVLFNLDMAKKHERVVIVEGPLDAIHVGPSAVATFGKKISLTQIMKLKYAGVDAIDLMWDGPSETELAGARPEMMQVASKLAGIFDNVRLVFVPKDDPGSYTREQNAEFISQARPVDTLSKFAVL